jgi:L-ascorbate metabolism protein UlaG (beta-lactamase superfamily)
MMNTVGLALVAAALTPGGGDTVFESDEFEGADGRIRITFIGHATMMLEYRGAVVHVDPVGVYADYAKMPKADIIIVTHEHQDHFGPKAIAALKKPGTSIVANEAVRASLGTGRALSGGQALEVGGIGIAALPAYNLSPDRLQFHPKGRDNGYVLSIGGKRIYIAGDTEDTPEMRSLGDIDIAFLPMNLPYTMTPRQVASAAKAFRPKVLYPYHFGETDTRELVDLMRDSPDIEVRIRGMA